MAEPDETLDLDPEDLVEEGPGQTLDLAPEQQELARSVTADETEIPGYTLLRCLGNGATGRVYEAVQESTQQHVAVKIIHRSGAVNVRGLNHEIGQLIALEGHPNVVRLLDANLEHAPPYLVMALMPDSMERYTASGSDFLLLDNTRLFAWLEQLAAALQHMHRRGILHCDLKPANVLLDQREQAQIVDFSQASLRDQTGIKLGTFWYMPPEQALSALNEGTNPEITWDIYGLGATLYHLMAGHPPRYADEGVETLSETDNVPEQLRLYANFLAQAPLQPVRSRNPKCHPDLAAIAERCLRVDPDERYQHMGEILDEISRSRGNYPLRARAQTPLYRTRCFLVRNSLLVAVMLICSGLLAHSYLKVRTALSEARSDRLRAERALTDAEELRDLEAFKNAVTEMDDGYASGTAAVAALTTEHPPFQTHLAQLSDALRALPFPKRYFRCRQAGYLHNGHFFTLESHQLKVEAQVSAMAATQVFFSPNLEWLVSNADNRFEIRDRRHSDSLKKVQSVSKPRSVAVSNEHLVVASDEQIEIWELESGRPVCLPLLHHGLVNNIALSPDGTTLLTGSADHTARLWTSKGTSLGRPLWHRNTVDSVAFSTDGERLLTCSSDRTAKVWSKAGRPLFSLQHENPVVGGSFSPDSNRLVTYTSNGRCFIWDDRGRRLAQLSPEEVVRKACFSPDRKTLLTLSDRLATLWDASTGQRIHRPIETGAELSSASFIPDGSGFLVGDRANRWVEFDLSKIPRLRSGLFVSRGVRALAPGAEGNTVLVVSESGVRFWDYAEGREISGPIRLPGLRSVKLNAAGTHLLTLGWRVQLWDLETRSSTVIRPHLNFDVRPEQAAFSGDGQTVAVALPTGVNLFDLTGQLIRFVDFPQAWRVSFAGETLLALNAGGNGFLINTKADTEAQVTGSLVTAEGKILLADAGGLHLSGPAGKSVLYSGTGPWHFDPRGRWALRQSRKAVLVSLNDGTTVDLKFEGAPERAVFSEDGEKLAVIENHRVRVWQTRTGKPWSRWFQHEEEIVDATFDRSGDRLLSVSRDGRLRTWELGVDLDLPPELLLLEAQCRTGLLWNDKHGAQPLSPGAVERWRKLAQTHADTCAFPEANFWLRRAR